MVDDRSNRPDGQDEQVQGQEAQSTEELLSQERTKAAEYLDNWRRVAAEFSNYKKRVDRDRAEYAQFANAQILAKLVDVMDGFDAAFQAIPPKFKDESWVEGIRLVEQKLQRVLESEGIKPIEAQGKDFDPNYHEAMFYEPTPGQPEGRITGEFQRGYMLGDRVLRPARVKVAKGDSHNGEKES